MFTPIGQPIGLWGIARKTRLTADNRGGSQQMTSDDDLHAHCTRPVYNITVESSADAVVLSALNATTDELWKMAEQERVSEMPGSGWSEQAYRDAARHLDKNLRAALDRYGKTTAQTDEKK